jgi:hypothetical protein
MFLILLRAMKKCASHDDVHQLISRYELSISNNFNKVLWFLFTITYYLNRCFGKKLKNKSLTIKKLKPISNLYFCGIERLIWSMNKCHQREKSWIDSIRDFKIAMKFKELEGLVYDKKT